MAPFTTVVAGTVFDVSTHSMSNVAALLPTIARLSAKATAEPPRAQAAFELFPSCAAIDAAAVAPDWSVPMTGKYCCPIGMATPLQKSACDESALKALPAMYELGPATIAFCADTSGAALPGVAAEAM